MSDFDPQKTARLYDVLRKQIEHEDDLISARVNWFVASQSFLFSAYAIVLSNLGPAKSLAITSQQHLLVLMIPTLAAVICILAWMTVLAGEIAISFLRKSFDPLKTAAEQASLPPVQGILRTQVLGMFPPHAAAGGLLRRVDADADPWIAVWVASLILGIEA